MGMARGSLWPSVLLVIFWCGISGQTCTKDIVYSKDYYTQPVSESFEIGMTQAMARMEKVLPKFGYNIIQQDEAQHKFITGWRPVEADSHYVFLFDRRDYGITDGTYYQLLVDLIQQGSKVKVALSTKIKTIVGPLESSKKVEQRILKQLADDFRSPQIEITNVEMRKK